MAMSCMGLGCGRETIIWVFANFWISSRQNFVLRQLIDYFATQAVPQAYLFGSVARGDYAAESDVDILVSFPVDATVTLFDLAGMRNELMELTGGKVDPVVAGSEHEHVQADSERAFWRGTMEPQRLPASTL